MSKNRTVKETKQKDSAMTIFTVSSESGDDYGPFLFDRKPTDAELEYWLREFCPGEWDDAEDEDNRGPGIFGSYLHVDMSEQTVVKL